MKKRVGAVILSLMTVLMTVACGSNATDVDTGSNKVIDAESSLVVDTAEVTFPKVSEERRAVEISAAEAVNKYIEARMYLDAFLDYDIENGNKEEYEAMLEQTIKAFEDVEETSELLMNNAGELEMTEASAAAVVTDNETSYLSYNKRDKSFDNPFVLKVYAAEDSEAVKWAKDITERFDNAPSGKGIRTLADQMGTDAKHAYAALKQAQDILAGNAYEDFAQTANAAYKTAKVLKTAGTSAQFALSIMTAGTGTAVEAVMTGGGIMINGLNTMLEIGETGSVLIVGDDNKLSVTLENMENSLAPVGAVIGVYGLAGNLSKGVDLLDDAPALADSLMYIGSSIYDYATEGKILGGCFTQGEDGTVSCTVVETMTIKSAWAKDNPECAEVLKAVGYSDEEVSKTLESIEEQEGVEATSDAIAFDTTEDVSVKADNSADTQEMDAEDVSLLDADSDTSTGSVSSIPTVDEIVGYYPFYGTESYGDQSAEGEIPNTVSCTGGNALELTDADGVSMSGTYNEATGVATFNDSDGTPVNITFTKKGNRIHAVLTLSAYGFSVNASADKE